MKTRFFLPVFLLILSCNTGRNNKDLKPGTPKALQDKSSVEIKRNDGDLVESLYQELAEKTPELKQLEESINNMDDSKADSMAAFVNFNNRNEGYYASTNRYLLSIKDSTLKNAIKQLLDNSLSKYHASVAADSVLIKAIDAKEITLEDLHTALKLTRTLPLIEQYQNDNKPSIKSLEGFEKQLDKSVKMADTLLKK